MSSSFFGFTDGDLAQAEAELGGGSEDAVAPEEEAAAAEDLPSSKCRVADVDDGSAALVGYMVNANKIGSATFTAKYGRKK